MKDLLIFPCNGNAIEAAGCLSNNFNLLGFIDDSRDKQLTGHNGINVYDRSALTRFPHALVLAVPGSPTSYRQRRDVINGLKIDESRLTSVIHPAAVVSTGATIGRNVLVMAGAVITSNAVIGNHVCILPNSVVHHDSSVGDYTLIGSGVVIAGYVTLSSNCYIGSGSCIKNNTEIGAGALVGMGSTVIRDVPPDAVVAGNPARQIR